MRVHLVWISLFWVLSACTESDRGDTRPTASPTPLTSGSAFLTPETRAMQADRFSNPGYLWVDRGRDLFHAEESSGPACASCHNEPEGSLAQAAAHHPTWDSESDRVINLEGRINQCRERYQSQPPLAYESEDLLALTSYVGALAQGEPIRVSVPTDAAAAYERGRTYFNQRRGQFHLSCTQCHDANWGKQLRGDTISQGHGNGFPAYRLEWQTLGSLHRRFQDCDAGVRAAPMALGSDTYLALEFYLAVRANGLAVETPAVRR